MNKRHSHISINRRNTPPLLHWLLIMVLGLSSILSAGHIHESSSATCPQHLCGDAADYDDDDGDNSNSFTQYCPGCHLFNLGLADLEYAQISAVADVLVSNIPDSQTAPRAPPPGLALARAPPALS